MQVFFMTVDYFFISRLTDTDSKCKGKDIVEMIVESVVTISSEIMYFPT